jgi:hypothetical protein
MQCIVKESDTRQELQVSNYVKYYHKSTHKQFHIEFDIKTL